MPAFRSGKYYRCYFDDEATRPVPNLVEVSIGPSEKILAIEARTNG
jgi:hypothetical protein